MPSQLLENAVASDRFNLLRLTADLRAHFDEEQGVLLRELENSFGQQVFKKVFERIIRSVFFIEPVNRDITSTKFEVRWGDNSDKFFEFNRSDLRYCCLDSCLLIFNELLNSLHSVKDDPEKKAIIVECIKNSLIPHEIILDYQLEGATTLIHQPGNLQWQWGPEAQQTIGLRAYLRSVQGQDGIIFKGAIENKIAVKTYLTDRSQTGLHQTNREKRWEAHPASVQFASRKTCWGIEHELLSQLFYFEGFPDTIRDEALSRGLLIRKDDVSRCPITLEPLNFSDFSAEILTPSHGRSKFQVGHMNPLKSVGRDNPEAGHTRSNISWVSSDGNRIQGHLSLNETRAMILKIAENYNATR